MPNWILLRQAIISICTLCVTNSAVCAQSTEREVPMEFAVVDNPGNPVDPITRSGKVDYVFEIGKFEVTNAQYAEFLNANAAYSDPYKLYNINMEKGLFGGIKRIHKNGRYFYNTLEGYANLPVVYVSWFDAARFCNWLHFGLPITGKSVLGTTEGNTEIGAYNTSAFSKNRREIQNVKTHNPKAKYWIPTLDEWNKAAYFDPYKDGKGGYWLYPTQSDTKPQAIVPPGNRFSANYYDFKSAAPAPYLTVVGSYKHATSYYDTFDQGGNVWEWVETLRNKEMHRWVRGGAVTNFDDALSRANVDSEYGDHELYIFGFRVARKPKFSSVPKLTVKMDFVVVGEPGNENDPVYDFGHVPYIYEIGKYEVTNEEYAEFLNAVAKFHDPYSLYSQSMAVGLFGGIERKSQEGAYTYRPKKDYEKRPVVYISWYDLARMANWYHYGKPNTGRSDLYTTEGTATYGAYDTRNFPKTPTDFVDYNRLPIGRNKKALYWIPNEDEWYKAAYYDPTIKGKRKYWNYPVKTKDLPNNSAPPGNEYSVNFFKEVFSIGKPYFITNVGAYKFASSYYKTYDQGGNVWEWAENWRRESRGSEKVRAVRGGSATYSEIGLHALNTDPGNPSHEKFIWGGRLARAHITDARNVVYSDTSYINPTQSLKTNNWFSKYRIFFLMIIVGIFSFSGICFFYRNNQRQG